MPTPGEEQTDAISYSNRRREVITIVTPHSDLQGVLQQLDRQSSIPPS